MSDLISTTSIYNFIKAQINPCGKPFEGTAYEFGLKVMEYIENVEDAYDVDKVVAELGEMKIAYDMPIAGGTLGFVKAELLNFDKVIEIVRKGGVE